MKKLIILLALAFAGAAFAAESPKPSDTTTAVVTKSDAVPVLEKERDALKAELDKAKKELADLRKSAQDTVNFLQRQRNDALGKLADVEINLAFAQQQLADLKKEPKP